jgi:hypothetical protein
MIRLTKHFESQIKLIDSVVYYVNEIKLGKNN